MNYHPETHSASSRFALATALVLLLAGNGCGKQESPGAQNAAPPPAAKPKIVSAEKNSFDEVTAQLDPGGSLYGYLSTSQWLDGLSGRIEGWRETILSLPNIGDAEKANINKGFDIAAHLIRNSGIESITGVGISGIALEKGFYQTKFVVHRDPNGPSGGIWTVFGRSPRPLQELDSLPADTVWAAFSDVDVSAIWNAVVKELDQSGLTQVKAGLDRLDGALQQATGKKLDELLGSLGGQCGAFLTLKEATKIQVPLPNGETLEVPEPGLVIALKVKDDTLFDLVDHALQNNPQVVRTDEAGLKMRTMPIPLPLPVTLRPTIAREGDHLFIASSDDLIKTIAAVKAGKEPGLKTTDEFKHLAQGLPLEGNSFAFVSQRLGDAVQRIQSSVLSQSAGEGKEAATALMQKVHSVSQPTSSFAVGRSTTSGWITVGHGTQQPANAIVLPLVVAPVAVIAGMTLPALAKAKSRAQSVSCMNNLKQMGLAARIYATDHNDAFPPDFLAMKNELVSPKILICPADPNHAASANLTWDNFNPSQSSYEYVTKGLTDSTAGIENKVLFRCRIHGTECMGDGRVVRKN